MLDKRIYYAKMVMAVVAPLDCLGEAIASTGNISNTGHKYQLRGKRV